MGICKGLEAREKPGVLEELEPGKMAKIWLEGWVEVGPTVQGCIVPAIVPALNVLP